MLPAPASIAAPPRPKSRASWNPAVPPPPVGGAAVGNGLADRLDVADGDADGLRLALGVVAVAVPLGNAVDLAEALPPGEKLVGAAEGDDAVQAETAAEARRVKVPQPMAVNLALSPVPAVVVRTFMEPPHASGRWALFPGPGTRNRHRKGNAWPTRHCPRLPKGKPPKAPKAIKVKPMDGTDMQWPVHHWNIRLRK